MDMRMWNDERESTPTCYKLDCGHAYHTKCIIECLKRSNLGCPNCNERKTPQEELTRKGLFLKAIREITKNPELRHIKEEYNESAKELTETRKQLKNDAIAFIKKRKQELMFDEKRAYFFKCIQTYKKQATKIAEKMSNMHLGATGFRRYRYGPTEFETFLLKGTGYRFWRLKRSTIYVCG
jgi:hypothetical protein